MVGKLSKQWNWNVYMWFSFFCLTFELYFGKLNMLIGYNGSLCSYSLNLILHAKLCENKIYF